MRRNKEQQTAWDRLARRRAGEPVYGTPIDMRGVNRDTAIVYPENTSLKIDPDYANPRNLPTELPPKKAPVGGTMSEAETHRFETEDGRKFNNKEDLLEYLNYLHNK